MKIFTKYMCDNCNMSFVKVWEIRRHISSVQPSSFQLSSVQLSTVNLSSALLSSIHFSNQEHITVHCSRQGALTNPKIDNVQFEILQRFCIVLLVQHEDNTSLISLS